MNNWNQISLFAGGEGFGQGFTEAGFNITKFYYSEIDKHALALLRYRFPAGHDLGSVTNVSVKPKGRTFVTFGWPCQDNSIAGKRAGHAPGTRSGLLSQAVRIVDEVRPEFFCAENVEGLRTVNKGTDIIEAIKYLAFLNESLPQYDVEMQLLNTRWFLPQNRERLYFVGHLRNGSRKQVFPIGENDKWYETESGVQRTRLGAVSRTIIARYSNNSNYRTGTYILQVNQSKESGGKQPYQQNRVYDAAGIVPALAAQLGKGMAVAGTLRTMKDGQGFREIKGDFSPTLVARARQDGSGQPCIKQNELIRRLTPIECERLQGWPDNWTKYGIYNGQEKQISDSQRYRICGNGVSKPCVTAIAEKLLELYS